MATLTATKTYTNGTYSFYIYFNYTYTTSESTTAYTVTVSKLSVTTGQNREPSSLTEQVTRTNAENQLRSGLATGITFGGTSIYSGTKKGTGTVTVNRSASVSKTSSAQTKSLSASGGGSTNSTNITVPALPTYTNTYYPNGGSGSNQTQTHQHGTQFQAKPANTFSRTNYTLTRWNTSSGGGSTNYTPGSSYTVNANLSLYAIWTQVYATPQMSISKAYRCDSSGTPDDEGTYAAVEVSFQIWKTSPDNSVSSLSCTITCPDDANYSAHTQQASQAQTSTQGINEWPMELSTSGNWMSGTCTFVVSAALDMDKAYSASVTLTDSKGGSPYSSASVMKSVVITTAFYTMDVLAGGHGICFGGVAKEEGFEVDFGAMRLVQSDVNSNTYYHAKNANSGRRIAFGIGNGGANAGIWDYDRNAWLMYSDGTDIFMYDPGASKYLNMGTRTITSGIVSAGANMSIVTQYIAIWGKLAMFYVGLKPSAAISASAVIATVSSSYRPIQIAYLLGHSADHDAYIETGGSLKTRAALTSGTEYYFQGAYLLA